MADTKQKSESKRTAPASSSASADGAIHFATAEELAHEEAMLGADYQHCQRSRG